MGKNRKGLKSTDWKLQNRYRDVKYGIKNIVNNIAIICMVSDVY